MWRSAPPHPSVTVHQHPVSRSGGKHVTPAATGPVAVERWNISDWLCPSPENIKKPRGARTDPTGADQYPWRAVTSASQWSTSPFPPCSSWRARARARPLARTSASWGALLRASFRKQLRAPLHGEGDWDLWAASPRNSTHTVWDSTTCGYHLWRQCVTCNSESRQSTRALTSRTSPWWGDVTNNTRSPGTSGCVKPLRGRYCGISGGGALAF